MLQVAALVIYLALGHPPQPVTVALSYRQSCLVQNTFDLRKRIEY